jgi:hypothetical protein
MGMLSNDFPIAPSNELSEEGQSMPYMPSPPTHEPSPTKATRIAIAEQQEVETTNVQLDTQEESAMSKFDFAFGSKSGSAVPAFEFETPTKAKFTQAETPPPSGPADLTAISEFLLGAATSSLSPEEETPSEEPKRVPLQEKVAKAINVSLSNRVVPSPYEFGSREKKLSSPFEFEVPIKLQPSSKINDSTARPPVLFECTLPEEIESKTSSDAIASTSLKQLEESDLQFPIPNNEPISNKINDTRVRPTTPPPKNEESFGYANITPNSIRYATYLPARQQHGLVTPPETPEMLIRSLSKPMGGSGYFRDELPRETGSPVPKVVRKPLPSTPPARVDEIRQEREEECESGAVQGTADCRCEEVEAEVRTGFLARLRFKGVKEKVKDQLKVARKSILRRKENGSPSSSNGLVLE